MNIEDTQKNRRGMAAWAGWILWITTVGGLWFIRHEAYSKDDDLLRSQKELKVWIERADKTMANLDSNKVVASVERQDANLSALEARMQAETEKLTEALKQQHDINQRFTASLEQGERRADEATKLAEAAWSAGQPELALAYLANAIRNQPRDMRLLEKYTAWSQEGGNPMIMQGAESLLQAAIYDVDAKDVPQVSELLAKLASHLAESSKTAENENKKSGSPSEAYSRLKNDSLDGICLDREKIAERIEALSTIAGQIADENPIDSDLMKEVSQQLELAKTCEIARQLLELSGMRFSNLAKTEAGIKENFSEETRAALLSALQAAESVVNQIWSVPMDSIPRELQKELLALPGKLKMRADVIQDIVGDKDVAEAKDIWERRRNQESEWYDYQIFGCEEAMQKCSKLLARAQGPESGKAVSDLYKEMAEKIKDLKEKQFNSYQKWATTAITSTYKYYTLSGGLGNDFKATNAYYKAKPNIREIDQKLLSPEVAQYLQAVFAKLLAVLPADKVAELQESLSFTSVKKKKLEDF